MGEERELFLTLLPSPFHFSLPPFPRKRLVLRLAHQSQKGEERGTISATIFPSPPPLPTFRRKEARNRWLSLHAYTLHPKSGIVNSLLVHYSELMFVKPI